MRKKRTDPRTDPRNWERFGEYGALAWNNPNVQMELFVTPEIKQKFGLKCRTTVELLEQQKAGDDLKEIARAQNA